ncbi:MAG TPA: gfo/Idh/MocA family oxidoreductase [Spirochaetaceae bacterium]|nr:gfo/Idh/MocA family oxidoreductase [Spirochaetaceae bacterium]
MDFIRWGVLSVSKHYRLRVHEQVKDSALARFVGIASRDREKAAVEAAQLGFQRSYGSYEALLADPEIDAVYIPLPNHLHAYWVKAAADAGKHILCEKPFAMDATEAEEAIRYARSRGVRVMEALMYRFHPEWVRAKQIVSSGEIGKIVFIQVHFSFNNKDPRNIRNMRETGGGAIMDIGCYAVSSSRFMMGCEPRRVLSLVSRDPELGIDMLSSGLLDFGEGQAQFSVSTQAYAAQRVEVVGASGKLSIQIPFNMYPDIPAELSVTTSIGTRTVQCGPAGQYRLMFDAFSESLLAGKPEPTPAEDAVATMKVLDALFRSEASGSWETLI